ncbi:DUF1428 domain-containing protein [Alteromonas pelagimontana]|uniref:DUF1428 domain-containing protein n=1 Tax=Alteromonas pelagimontana TaxID=1858656 RepID=A0A6M4MHL4_9ALTE|nr:DUF1428 domain-containing protein [Alteromonas pelagimontana]QJR81676.1 DUF1428 domain-containing protein [Alteromonas pelagimontana]
MSYVDGFVCAVANDKKAEYIELARKAAEVFKRCGGIQVVETWGDKVPAGKKTSFALAVQCKDDETVVFSWVWWPSKDIQKAGMEAFMEDPICDSANNPMPFDGSRLIYGSFNVIVEE